jgi:hypothetical protein
MKRLQNEPVVVGMTRPVHRQAIRVGGQIDDGCVNLLKNFFRGANTVFLSLQSYVHQNQFRAFSGGDGNALFSIVDGADHGKANSRQALSEFFNNQGLVFNDQGTESRGNRISMHDDPP